MSTTIGAPPEAVFAVLADPAQHPAIDGTGWLREPLDVEPITAVGQVFRMDMFSEGHPDGDYRMANLVETFDAPRVIAWKPGQESPETGELGVGGWSWRYDLEPVGSSSTKVVLTYDWSGATSDVREFIQFPPFELEHLERSLQHLSELVGAST